MKLKSWIAMFILIIGLAACSAGGKQWAGDPQLVHKLQLKMSEADVRGILGEPSKITNMDMLGQKQDMWRYEGSERVTVLFQNGKLVNASLGRTTIIEAGASDI